VSGEALADQRPATAAARAPARGALARRWPDLAVGLGLLVLTLAYYYPIVGTDRIVFDFDIWLFFYPLRQYAVDALEAGRFPLWTPDIFLGVPFFANAQTALLYPLNAVFLVLGVPYAYAVSLWLHTWLAGVFTYLLARAELRLSLAGALVAALAFSLGGFLTGLAGHINQAQAAPWLPLLALLLLRAVARRSLRWAVAAAAALALQTLAGHTQEVYLSLVALAVLAVLAPWLVAVDDPASDSLARRARLLPGSLVLYAIVAVLGLALVAVQVVPTAELQREGIRGGGLAYPEAVSFSLPPNLLLQALLPGFWHNPFGEFVGYVGVIPLGLALLALAVAPPRWALVGGVFAGLGLALAIGGYNPLYPLLYKVVPGLGLFRVPARWLFVYSFGVALLAGLGADWIWRVARGGWRPVVWPRVAIVAVVAAVGLVAMVLASPPLGARRYFIAWGALALVGALLTALALWGWRRLALGALVVVTAVELFAASGPANFRAAIPPDAYRAARPVLAPVLAAGDEYRVLSLARDDYALGEIAAQRFPYPNLPTEEINNYSIALKLDEVLSHNLPLEYHLSTVDGYDGGVLPLRRWVDLMRQLVEEDEPRVDGVLRNRLHYLPDERLVDLLNVRWVLTSSLQDATVGGIPYDRLVTRRLAPGERFELPVANLPTDAVALLSSVADGDALDGATVGRLTVIGADGRAQPFDIRLGRHTARAAPPGEGGTELPTASPPDPRLRNVDYATRLPLGVPTTATRLVFENPAPNGTWLVRAATLLPPGEGAPQPLPLSASLALVPHDDPSPVKRYYNASALPPVFLVPRTVVADDAQALAYLSAPEFAPARVATVALGTGAHSLEGTAAETEGVRILERTPERWVLATEAAAERFLVLTQAYFPGWQATVDGVATPLARADYLFQGLYVPAGAHRVEIAYQPRSLLIGGAISAAAHVLAVILFVLARVRWPWPRRPGRAAAPGDQPDVRAPPRRSGGGGRSRSQVRRPLRGE
jgi:hypothetical protein